MPKGREEGSILVWVGAKVWGYDTHVDPTSAPLQSL